MDEAGPRVLDPTMTASPPLTATTVSLPPSDSLRDYLEFLRLQNPAVVRAWAAANEASFLDSVEVALDSSIRRIEGMARQLGGSSEKLLSVLLCQFMDAGGLPTSSEANHNGHVDVVIRHPAYRFGEVLGECKIYAGYEKHCEACDQILNRYCSGRCSRCFCIEFFQVKSMYDKMKVVREDMDKHLPHSQSGSARDHSVIKGGFVTVHLHFTSTTVEIVHLCCNTFHPDA